MEAIDERRALALRGAIQLVIDATRGVTTIVEDMHRSIASGPAILGRPLQGPATVGTALVYGTVRGVTSAVGITIDAALAGLGPYLGDLPEGPRREVLVAVLNGVVGDHLERTGNPLGTGLQLRHQGRPLVPETLPRPSPHLLLTVHGSCMTDRQWLNAGHDHAAVLADALGATRVDVLYNSGRHVSHNGAELAEALQALVHRWPVEVASITILAHSMGGLVSRSALHAAERMAHTWLGRVRDVVFLGTPHHGAPLERLGNLVDVALGLHPHSAPLARLGQIRSAGVTDLRFGNVVEAHWSGRGRFERLPDTRSHVPLPAGVRCFAVAGRLNATVGDGLVPVDSALGRHDDASRTLGFPAGHTRIVDGVDHLALLSDPTVLATLRGWLQ